MSGLEEPGKSPTEVGILDFGSGNVQALANVYRRAGVDHRLIHTPEDLSGARRLILPGVGAFDAALSQLTRSGLLPALERAVLAEGRPLLAICVGMQLLAESSEEGEGPGLGWVPGRIRRFEAGGTVALPLPHMGWNRIQFLRTHAIAEALSESSELYFLHSYRFECDDPADILATTTYGVEFPSIVQRANVLGVQGHPEKSHETGTRILLNFAASPAS